MEMCRVSGDGGVWRAANGCVAYAPNTYGGQGCDVGKSAMSGKSEISGEEWMRSWGIASLRMGIALCGVMVGIW